MFAHRQTATLKRANCHCESQSRLFAVTVGHCCPLPSNLDRYPRRLMIRKLVPPEFERGRARRVPQTTHPSMAKITRAASCG